MSRYWRHHAVPYIEVRNVEDGRTFTHGRHSHTTFSIGAIMTGHSTYLHGHSCRPIASGSVVIISPGVVHACNPLHDQPWGYRMFYVDAAWLGSLQGRSGIDVAGFVPFEENYSTDPNLFADLDRLYCTLTGIDTTPETLQAATLDFFQRLVARLTPASNHDTSGLRKVADAADFIREHCMHPLCLDEIAAAVQLSQSYLIRTFKAHYGLTPHAFLIDCRLQLARDCLRRGDDIAQVAAQVGFADQAHLQRLFKRTLAATPGQYRGLITQATNKRRNLRALRPCPD